MPRLDEATLQAALVGFTAQLDTVNQRIAEIQKRLGGRAAVPVSGDSAKPKRQMSAAAIKRIRAAQKKRWAAFHAKQKPRKKSLRKDKTEEFYDIEDFITIENKKPVRAKVLPNGRVVPATRAKRKPKTKMSAARKAALIANLAKARAAKAEKAKATA